jgi:hypothetical protein
MKGIIGYNGYQFKGNNKYAGDALVTLVSTPLLIDITLGSIVCWLSFSFMNCQVRGLVISSEVPSRGQKISV